MSESTEQMEKSMQQFNRLEELCREKKVTIPPVVIASGGRYPMQDHRDMCQYLGSSREEEVERLQGEIEKLLEKVGALQEKKALAQKEAKEFRDVQEIIDVDIRPWEEPDLSV